MPGSTKSYRERLSGFVRDWSIPRQLRGEDPMTEAAKSEKSRKLRPRLEEADRVGTSICPYCAVGCAQLVYARGNEVIHIEGDPRSPINQGTLCPKGAATVRLDDEPQPADDGQVPRPVLRPLGGTAARLGHGAHRAAASSRPATRPSSRSCRTASRSTTPWPSPNSGGATLDNEENYLIKKLCGGGLGMVWIENQARV